MPGYGVLPADEGTGLLPWSWATARLTDSHEYWLATVRADGSPHVTPVWGVWHDGRVWFSCSGDAVKARNLGRDDRCVVTTDDTSEPVMVEGTAERVIDRDAVVRFTEMTNAKYGVSYPVEFYLENACFRVLPRRVIALDDADFTGSPTRWTFEP
jgi:PPOX class probable F420-dependent enzyme